jgi:hypothetical protein
VHDARTAERIPIAAIAAAIFATQQASAPNGGVSAKNGKAANGETEKSKWKAASRAEALR